MIIHSTRIYFEEECKSGYLEIEDGKFKDFYPEDAAIKADVDYGENRIIPGIFDTHNHGGFGYRMNAQTTEEDVKAYLKGQASYGVTCVLPTTSEEKDLCCIALLAKMSEEKQDGAKIIGIHSEGPWGARVGEKGINTGYPSVKMDIAKKMVEAGNGKLKMVGIAPEVPGAHEAIRYFISQGVTMAAYHTNANYEEANAGIDCGITVATHLGNVMTGLHHRDIGTLGACLLRDEVDCEIICDGMHVSLPMIQLMLKVKDHDKIIMISDNVQYAGAPVGTYKGMNQAEGSDRKFIHVTEEGFVLSDSGRISGSSKPVLYGIYNLVEKLGMDMEEVMKFFAYNPTRKHGDITTKGSIKLGKDADFVAITDDYKVIHTYLEGRKIYDQEIDKDLFNPKFVEEYKVA